MHTVQAAITESLPESASWAAESATTTEMDVAPAEHLESSVHGEGMLCSEDISMRLNSHAQATTSNAEKVRLIYLLCIYCIFMPGLLL